MRRIGEEEEQQPQSTALRFSLYKYVNTCKLFSSRSHHCRQKREKKRERIREKLLCIVFSSSYSEIINNIDRAPGYIYTYIRARLYIHPSLVTYRRRREKSEGRFISWLSISLEETNKAHGRNDDDETLSGPRFQCFHLSSTRICCWRWEDALSCLVRQWSLRKTA